MKKYMKILLFLLLILTIIYFNYKTNNINENMSNIFQHSGPNSNSADNLQKIDCLTKVNYKVRKSITGKFNEYGPDHSKESYKFDINSCNCPPFDGPEKNNILTSKDFVQTYPTRLSPTGIFIDKGPIANNEYNYDSFITGCNCPKYGAT